MELNSILDGEQPQEQPQEEVAKVEAEQQQEQAPEVEATPEQEQGESPPTGDKAEKTVPLSALESVRTERKDWKEKALRLEGEIAAMRAAQQQSQQPQDQVELDPLTAIQEQMFNERLNNSEMLLRQEGHEDVDEKLEIFQQALQENPALGAELRKQVHPWKWMYQQASKMALMKEIGDDPVAYRKRIEEEIRASLQPTQPQQPVPQAQIPQSLAGARSAGSRSATTWSGPSSLDSILN